MRISVEFVIYCIIHEINCEKFSLIESNKIAFTFVLVNNEQSERVQFSNRWKLVGKKLVGMQEAQFIINA